MENLIFQQVSLEEITEKTANTVIEKLQELKLLQPQKKQEKYLTRNECADMLQISLVTLNVYSKKGIVPSYRIGSTIRYKLSEIEAIIERGLRFTLKDRRA